MKQSIFYFYAVSRHARTVKLIASWCCQDKETVILQACAMCVCTKELKCKTAAVIVLEDNDPDKVVHSVDLHGDDTLLQFREKITAVKQASPI